MLNLLLRFYDPLKGHVFFDGRDIRCFEKDELRSRFGTVLQNDHIFADSVAENISLGRDIPEERTASAAGEAGAYEFINPFEDGFNHIVSAGGADLSGGQRQRLLIARALAGDPEVLVFDDAASALDYQTESKIREAIGKRSGMTMIVIAQRISQVMNLDHILVMDGGRIIGEGNHEKLLETCPEYLDIYNTQMGERD